MGKIVKYCAHCEESFAHKFGFCPNCGGTLKAFEMSPVREETKVAADRIGETADGSDAAQIGAADADSFTTPTISSNGTHETSAKTTPAVVSAVTAFSANGASSNGAKTADGQPRLEKTDSPESSDESKIADIPKTEIPVIRNSTTAAKPLAAAVAANNSGNGHRQQTAKTNFQSAPKIQDSKANDGFRVTVIEEKNAGQRNLLLLGSMLLVMSLALGGLVYSLFNKDTLVGSIDSDSPLYITPIDDVPVEVEEKPKPEIAKDTGGGGGGGKDNPQEVTKGALPTQVEKPLNPPLMVTKMTNPDFVVKNETQGTIKRPPTNEQVGVPNGLTSDRLSSGRGSGGGFGSGSGLGAGGGRGTGEGNGIGSGSGNGNGNGNGDGNGDGTGGRTPPPPPPAVIKPPAPVGPSVGINIISKPQPKYTDAARTNNVQGTVTLKITFLASGQIGSIAPVSGLPYGLTEQAIAAARQIRFEPPKRNGVPYSVAKTLAYSFSIY